MSSILSMVLAIASVFFIYMLDATHVTSLLNLQAFSIVLGGSLLSAMAQIHPERAWHSVKTLSQALSSEPSFNATIEQFQRWSQLSRSHGFLALDKELVEISDPIVREGIQLATDGRTASEIRNHLSIYQERQQEKIYEASEFFESIGGYAPTFGIIGAVLGLIQVMSNIESPESLGNGIATAFVATVYGVGSANLIFLPIAQRLKNHGRDMDRYYSMVQEGCSGLADGENPRNLETRLRGFI
ncbi:motility protein A [Gynuella sunshinyii]|uniref:Flagellar motor component n=1 Tax=Gynuella sunshinyii YC6258 TaxID=1445510 RepID=A0A0C5VLJ1_9GAMM|nr:MotA/TolQ/ExbB proton channel family protein [Gynuella sunshinyii]AJQ95161.1 flagellar motor component [Gynuella sunshinyii YC6258]